MRRIATSCATAVAIALGFASPSATAKEEEPKNAAEAFHQVIVKLIDAEDRGDATAMAALFTKDAVLLPPNAREPIYGDINVREFLREFAKRRVDNHKIVPGGPILLGGTGTVVESGTWSGELKVGAQLVPVTGTYLAVGVLDEGKWKLWATSWQQRSTDEAGAAGK